MAKKKKSEQEQAKKPLYPAKQAEAVAKEKKGEKRRKEKKYIAGDNR